MISPTNWRLATVVRCSHTNGILMHHPWSSRRKAFITWLAQKRMVSASLVPRRCPRGILAFCLPFAGRDITPRYVRDTFSLRIGGRGPKLDSIQASALLLVDFSRPDILNFAFTHLECLATRSMIPISHSGAGKGWRSRYGLGCRGRQVERVRLFTERSEEHQAGCQTGGRGGRRPRTSTNFVIPCLELYGITPTAPRHAAGRFETNR